MRGLRVGLAVVALLAGAGPALAARFTLALDQLPDWVRDAARRTAPSTGADAVLLHQEEIIEPVPGGGVRMSDRLAVRILAPRASAWLASECAVVYEKGEDPPQVSIWTLAADGQVLVPAARDDLIDVPYKEEHEDFGGRRVRRLPAVAPAPGAVVAFESVRVARFDRGSFEFLFGDDEHPTLLSRLVVRLPENWSADGVVRGTAQVEQQREPRRLVYTARNLESRPPVALRPSRRAFLTRVAVHWWSGDGTRGFKDWDHVGRYMYGLHAAPGKDAESAHDAGRKLQPATPEGFIPALERAFALAALNVRYAAVQLGVGGFQPHAPSEVLRNRYGDCKDKTTLLRALLEPWPVTVHPVLVRTRDEGYVDADVPGLYWFNHEIAALELPAGAGADLEGVLSVDGVGRLLFVDPTNEDDFRTFREDDEGTLALLVLPDGGRLVPLPVGSPHRREWTRTARLAVDGAGAVVQGVVTDQYSPGAAVTERVRLRGLSAAERNDDVTEWLQHHFPAAVLEEDRLERVEQPGTSLERTVRFRGGRAGQRAGQALVVEAGRAVESSAPAQLPAPPYTWSLDVGAPRREIVEVEVTLPSGWTPESLPAPVTAELPEVAFSASWSAPAAGTLVYHRTLAWRTPWIEPARYVAFRAAILALARSDRASLVLVPRPAAP